MLQATDVVGISGQGAEIMKIRSGGVADLVHELGVQEMSPGVWLLVGLDCPLENLVDLLDSGIEAAACMLCSQFPCEHLGTGQVDQQLSVVGDAGQPALEGLHRLVELALHL